MNYQSIIGGFLGGLITVAVLTVVLRKSSDTANVIKTAGNAVSSTLNTAMGNNTSASIMG